MTYRVKVKSYDEGVEALAQFEFPVTICDPTGRSYDDHFPDECPDKMSACSKLDHIFEYPGNEDVVVEMFGEKSMLRQLIEQNPVQSDSNRGA